jgi:hypothetical protein
MGTKSIKFSMEKLLAFRTTSNLEDWSFLSGYFPLGRDSNPGTTHRVSGTWGPLRVGATTP